MTAQGRALMVLSLSVAVLAIFWPDIAPHAIQLAQKVARSSKNAAKGSGSACPLGYTSGSGVSLPVGHPSVPGPLAGTAGPSDGAPPAARLRKLVWFLGDIWTGDAARPRAQSMAVDAATGVIVQLGGAPEEGGGEEVVDLGGKFVMPSIVDSHTHFIPGGLSLSSVDLRNAASKEEFIATIAAGAAALGPDDWVLGGFWDDNRWGGNLPDASWVDAAAGGRPALLMRMDSHLALANTAALKLAGVGPETPNPKDGLVDKDPSTGLPTGILRETAMRLVTSAMPPPSVERRRSAVLAAGRYALSRGITSVVDFGRAPFADQGASWADLEEVYDPMADAGQLPVRVYAFVPLEQRGALAARVAARGLSHPGGRLHVGGVKAFADGSLGSRTALMRDAYADAPGTLGARAISLDALRRGALAADAVGLQVAVHAIGDRALDDVLEVFDEVLAARAAREESSDGSCGCGGGCGAGGAPAAPPLRVEHAQHISGPDAARRFGALASAAPGGRGGAVAAVANPQHLLTDTPMLLPRLGAERAAPGRAFAWPLLAAEGVRVAAGSDWPVVDALPFLGVRIATSRALKLSASGSPAGGDEGEPRAREAAAEEALAMHTAASADLAHAMGRLVGRLEPGRRADFIVLRSSPLLEAREGGGGPGAAGDGSEVLRTYVDGRCAFGCGGGDAGAE